MPKKILWLNTLLVAVFGFTIALANSNLNMAASSITQAQRPSEAINQDKLKADYAKLPLSFEVNLGQTDAQVKFLSKGSDHSLFLTPTEAVLALRTNTLHMQLLGANLQPQVTGLEPLPGKVNYFLGNDPKQWRTNIPTYAKVQYQQVYPGVDLVYYGNPQQLEYDFLLAPGTDPNTVKLAFKGADQLEVDAQGNLVLQIAGGQIQLHKPLVYQEVDGVRQVFKGGYVLKDQRFVSFQAEGYDPKIQLVIDPVLAYSTYLGSNGGDNSYHIDVDTKGNAYVTGATASTDFPSKNPLQPTSSGNVNSFVAKLNPQGSALVYSTYLGGSAPDTGFSIAVDAKGNAYVAGNTKSSDFPTKNPLQPSSGNDGNSFVEDAFVAKLNPQGSALVYSTYLGGNGDDSSQGIAVDTNFNAYVTGLTSSTNFPTKNPLQPASTGAPDAFVAKLNPQGSALVYSTYLGGSQYDNSSGIAVDVKGNAYLKGYTSSTNFPTKNAQQSVPGGSYDNFVAKLNRRGSALVYSTYLGGSGVELGNGVAVDANGNTYVTGSTTSTDFPTKNPLQPNIGGDYDAFVAKLNQQGSFIYSTYLGGSQEDRGNSIAVDAKGNVYLTGFTYSNNFPTKHPLQPTNYGFSNSNDTAFVAKITP